MTDDAAISYLAAVIGTPVLTSSGTKIGTLEHVLQVPEPDTFDGIVVATRHGLRFIDADHVAEITRGHIRARLSDTEVDQLPPPTARRCTASMRCSTRGTTCTTISAACSAARTGNASTTSPRRQVLKAAANGSGQGLFPAQ